jgi:hypothetical protein
MHSRSASRAYTCPSSSFWQSGAIHESPGLLDRVANRIVGCCVKSDAGVDQDLDEGKLTGAQGFHQLLMENKTVGNIPAIGKRTEHFVFAPCVLNLACQALKIMMMVPASANLVPFQAVQDNGRGVDILGLHRAHKPRAGPSLRSATRISTRRASSSSSRRTSETTSGDGWKLQTSREMFISGDFSLRELSWPASVVKVAGGGASGRR